MDLMSAMLARILLGKCKAKRNLLLKTQMYIYVTEVLRESVYQLHSIVTNGKRNYAEKFNLTIKLRFFKEKFRGSAMSRRRYRVLIKST